MTKIYVLWLFEGFVEGEEKEGVKGEAMRAREVLKAIEKCIETFWVFVKTDNKKSWPKFRSLLWAHPPVEDPRDLELLADLSRRLKKVNSKKISSTFMGHLKKPLLSNRILKISPIPLENWVYSIFLFKSYF